MKPINTKLRSLNTKFWDDSYVIELSTTEKLFFLYVLTNPLTNLAGVYELTKKRIISDTGIVKEELESIIQKFEKDEKIIFKDGYIIIKNFLKHQSLNKNMFRNVLLTLEQLPSEIKKTYLDFVQPQKIHNQISEAFESLRKSSEAFESLRKIEIENEIENEIEIEDEIERERETGKGKQKAVSKKNAKPEQKNFYNEKTEIIKPGLNLIEQTYGEKADIKKIVEKFSIQKAEGYNGKKRT